MATIHRNWRQTRRKQTLELELWNAQEIFETCFSPYSLLWLLFDQKSGSRNMPSLPEELGNQNYNS